MLPGTLYNLINKMLEEGLIEESGERLDPELDDELRRYYRLSGTGEKTVSQEAARLDGLERYARKHGLLAEGEKR